MQKPINILNKRARFDYEIMDKFVAGIQLTGTEIKSIRLGKASVTESFCEFHENELFVVNMYIQEYSFGTHYNHVPRGERRLLLTKKELKGLQKNVENKGLTIIPLRLFINDRGLAKLEIALGRGKKLYDKRETLKTREVDRKLDRIKKEYR
ncbi:MAG: SsrA-binding protein [Bacteroidetes bacterium HGW-Bacteroidetes-13]|nr:MAG: SsrA-binding protein [Bacteroidetes bacterium HGW-Bacteroidetes-13]